MDTLLTYDLAEKHESKHTQVKDAMKKRGYHDSWKSDNTSTAKTIYLPNTTLWKNATTPSQAKADLEAVAKECAAEIERLVAVEFISWAAIEGKPYASDLWAAFSGLK